MANNQHYREGGWGWFVVLSFFLAEFIVFGTFKAFGVLITSMKEDFDTDLWIIGSISALHFGVQFVMTPLASAIARRYGGRRVIICGGILYGLGLVLSCITYNIAVFATSLIVIAGVGASCVIEPTFAEIAFYFHDKFAVASFLALAGAPVGVMLYGPMTQVLLDTYGWRGTMLLLGGLGFNLVWVGVLVRRPKKVYDGIPHEDIQTDDDEGNTQQTNHVEGKLCHSLVSTIGLDVFLNFEFILMAGIRMLNNTGYGGFVVYMVPNALVLGLSPKEASFLTTAFGVGSLAGLFLGALLLHTKALSDHVSIIIAAGIAAITLAVTPLIPTFTGQLMIAFIIGAGTHWLTEIVSVLTKHLPIADDRFVIVLGWASFLSGIGSSLGDVISGWLYDVTDSFIATFLLLSSTMVAVIFCSIVDFARIRYTQRSNANSME